jgi:hypothetical protein
MASSLVLKLRSSGLWLRLLTQQTYPLGGSVAFDSASNAPEPGLSRPDVSETQQFIEITALVDSFMMSQSLRHRPLIFHSALVSG